MKIIHLDILAQAILDAGIQIECIMPDGTVQPADLQALAQPIIDAFDDSMDAQRAREVAAKEAAEPLLVDFRDKAQMALDINNTFLALAAPTNAQVLAQVKALTQEMNRVIKSLGRLIMGKDLA